MFQAAVPLVASPVFGLTYKVAQYFSLRVANLYKICSTSPSYSGVCQATIDTFPGAFLLLVAGLSLLCSVLLFTVTWGLGMADSLRRIEERRSAKEKLLVVQQD